MCPVFEPAPLTSQVAAVDLQVVSDLAQSLASLGTIVLLGYFSLIAITALTAVFSKQPARRKAALEVLRLLRRNGRGGPPET